MQTQKGTPRIGVILEKFWTLFHHMKIKKKGVSDLGNKWPHKNKLVIAFVQYSVCIYGMKIINFDCTFLKSIWKLYQKPHPLKC